MLANFGTGSMKYKPNFVTVIAQSRNFYEPNMVLLDQAKRIGGYEYQNK